MIRIVEDKSVEHSTHDEPVEISAYLDLLHDFYK